MDRLTPPAGTVLVVDDEPLVLRVASKVVESLGHQVIEASNGDEALRLAEAHEGPLLLLLTDVVMPGLGGRALAERLREQRPETAVLFMSAYTEDEVLLEGIRVAEVDFIAKPFSVDGLRQKILQVLSKRSTG